MTALDHATDEIVRLHRFIEGWFQGGIPEDRFDPDFADALHPDFENIQPSGKVLPRSALLDPIRAAKGANPDFRITIEEPRLLGTWPAAGLILATYVEHQTGARNSAPDNRRRSTVLFETGPRLMWRHLQETGL
ncbi:MAG: DUF4440 domain-containing protein [Pseudomonadota bacterium]